jgi:hypothetical protein
MEKSNSGGDDAALMVYRSSVGMVGISRDCNGLRGVENQPPVL